MTLSCASGRSQPPRLATLSSVVLSSVVLALCLSACSARSPAGTASAIAKAASAPARATAPHLLMDDGSAGWAVWPSGESWLLLHTTDGWRHVTNVTPIAVPTNGGLVVADAEHTVAVAVGTYERLTQSPLLTKSGDTADWNPAELPGPVVNARAAVGISPKQTTALIDATTGGTVVTNESGNWGALTSASKLAPAATLRLDGTTWATDELGWLTGHAAAGTPVAFQTKDAGTTWAPLQSADSVVAALAPCGAGQVWLLPFVTANGKIVVERTADAGTTWTAGASLTLPSASPVWGCDGDEVWLAASSSGHPDHVFASHDGGSTWEDRGPAPRGLTDLTPTGGGSGFAVSQHGHTPTLWAVTDDGRQFTDRQLPAWVATLGAQTSTS